MDLVQSSEQNLLINFMVKEQNDRSSFGRPSIRTNSFTNPDLGQIQACSSKVCNLDHLENISPHFSLRKYSFNLNLQVIKPTELFCLTVSTRSDCHFSTKILMTKLAKIEFDKMGTR